MKAALFVLVWAALVALFCAVIAWPETVGRGLLIAVAAVVVLGVLGGLAHAIIYGFPDDEGGW